MTRPAIAQQITFIYTTDLGRAAAFYGETLGLPMVLDQGGCRIYHVAGEGYLGVCGRPAEMLQRPDPERRSVILTLVSPDVDGWYAHLQEQGVTCEEPPRRSPEFGIYHFFVRDPDGYLIEIQRFENPRWNLP